MPPWRAIAGRTVVFVLLAAWINVGPFLQQSLGVRAKYMQRWVMFAGMSLDTCVAEYSTPGDSGGRVPLDRFDVFQQPPDYRSAKELRQIRSLADATKLGKRMCSRVRAPVFARVTCATRKGWKVEAKGEEDLCASR
jgi:hypothetical protein